MEHVKIGFRTAGFREWPVRRALAELARLGYGSVELCLEHPDMRPEQLGDETAAALTQETRNLGLAIASVSYHGDADELGQRGDNQLRSIGLTAAMGCDLLVLNTPRALPGLAGGQWDEFVQWLAGGLLPEAERRGVRLAFEPEPGLLLHGTAEMQRLRAALPHPLLGVNLDIGHAWLTDGDVAQAVRDLAPWLWHVHFEDFPAGEHRHLPPGAGDMPLGEIVAALREIGYSGPWVIDLFNIADDPVAAARESLAGMRPLLEGA